METFGACLCHTYPGILICRNLQKHIIIFFSVRFRPRGGGGLINFYDVVDHVRPFSQTPNMLTKFFKDHKYVDQTFRNPKYCVYQFSFKLLFINSSVWNTFLSFHLQKYSFSQPSKSQTPIMLACHQS